ncbi:MAG: HupE/UreJ family protein [Hyphomicrobiales bacterium]|nr:HupE/UreJ family protein [Hyphomicrobiales bacterium]
MPFYLAAVILTLAATPALAHVGAGHTGSFLAGVAHPIGGLDHLIAMITVGLWGALAGGRALWLWPAAFLLAMIGGFSVAALGIDMPFVEPAILASVIVLGLLVTLAVRAPVWIGAAIVASFAVFHGHAHGTEAGGEGLALYAAGFALATAALHLAGLGFGLLAERGIGQYALRGLGLAAMLGGVAIVAGLAG